MLSATVIPRLFDGKTPHATRSGSGCPAAPPARKPIPSRCCCASMRIARRQRARGCRFSPPTSTKPPSPRRGRDVIPSTLLQGLSPERLVALFCPWHRRQLHRRKEVRELCTFSAHSLTRDPPFSRIDLVSCRNLLIYLDLELQAVGHSGFPLFAGSGRHSAARQRRDDQPARRVVRDPRPSHRIFQKRDVPSPPLHMTGRDGSASRSRAGAASPPHARAARASHGRATGRARGCWSASRRLRRGHRRWDAASNISNRQPLSGTAAGLAQPERVGDGAQRSACAACVRR